MPGFMFLVFMAVPFGLLLFSFAFVGGLICLADVAETEYLDRRRRRMGVGDVE